MNQKQVSPLMSEDLTTLAAKVVEGLRTHLTGHLQLGMEQLFKEHEKRLLAALMPKNAAGPMLRGQGHRLNTGSSVNNSSCSSLRFPQSGDKNTSAGTPSGEYLHLDVRNASKESQSQCSLKAGRKRTSQCPESVKHSKSEKSWMKRHWERLSSGRAPLAHQRAPPAPSGVRSLGEARDGELLALVPPSDTQSQQPTSRSSSYGVSISGVRREDQATVFGTDSEAPSLPGLVRMCMLDQKRPPEDDQPGRARGLEEQADAAAAAAAATEFQAHGDSPNGRTTEVAITASAADAPACQLTYERIVAILKHDGDLPGKPAAPSAEAQGCWTTGAATGTAPSLQRESLAEGVRKPPCIPNQRSFLSTASALDDTLEAGVVQPMKCPASQSISTLSSSVSVLSSSTRQESVPANLVYHRAHTGDLNVELTKSSLRRMLNAKAFASDTKAACLKRQQELLGDSSRMPDRAIGSERKCEGRKLGIRQHLSARKFASDTKAARLTHQDEFLQSMYCYSTKAQGRYRTFSSDTKAARLSREEELLGGSSTAGPDHRHDPPAQERATPEPARLSLRAKIIGSDTKATRLEREEELLGEMKRPRLRHQKSSQVSKQVLASAEKTEPALTIFQRAMEAEARALDAQMMRWKMRGAQDNFFSEGVSTVVEENPSSLCTPSQGSLGQRMDSPLLLRLCGLLPWGSLWVAHWCVTVLLAASLVAIFMEQFYQGQRLARSAADCPWGICIHFGHLSDLVLSMGSFSGVLAMRTLTSLKLLGSPTDLLPRFALEHNVMQKWSYATLWNYLSLAFLWAGSLAFRAVTMPPDPSLMDGIRASAFALASLLFMSLVFGILHVSCITSILIDAFAMSVSKSADTARSIQEWDRLGALLRRVSRAVDRGFLLLQIAAMTMLLCSFTDVLLQGDQRIWWFLSTVMLAQSLVLLLSRAAEVTEMCTRLPSLINSMDFAGDDLSMQRHYLVEHISYSAAGFYVGEIRLTGAIALRGTYIILLVAVGVLTKLTQHD